MKHLARVQLAVALAAVGSVLMTCPAAAANAVFSNSAGSKVALPFSLGYVFTVSQPLNLTALGQFDAAGDGAIGSAKIAVFNWTTGVKLVDTTLAGAVLEETGFYDTHFVNIPAIALSPGTQYLVAVEVAANDFVYGNGIVTFDPAVQWVAGRATPVGSPAMPGTATATTFSILRTTETNGSYLGPNMKLSAADDSTPPVPNPMTFAIAPHASSPTSISMEATPASDFSGVDYYFAETSGAPGGSDSGWQTSPFYEDGGLTTGLSYTYTVTARDRSANQNSTSPSGPASAVAENPPPLPSVVTIQSPTSRHIVQRNSSNTGSIPITGSYTQLATEIQARAVVMTGSGNSGVTTAWQTINAAPSGGAFTGTLSEVPAGGWYQVEVRAMVGGEPGTSAIREKIGVGDIFVTAGQSNSANYGTGGYVPADDRVSARTTANGSTWVFAQDPLPIASSTGGSVWTRLGDQLATALDIPIGFIALGVGSTQVSQWTPGTSNYNNLLKPAIQSFPANGFRAFLWHQGESDSIANVTAATHASRLASMIAQSRLDVGWSIPWYLAEASFHPNTTLSQEILVAAGQRLAVHNDPLVFLGPSTDEFHLEDAAGGKLKDSVHFNTAGLLDHATQWKTILLGLAAISPENHDFEDNHTSAITNQSALADGASYLVTPSANLDSPMVLDWRILSAAGATAADGANGIHNPAAGTFGGAVDSANGGVLPNMAGKHVALLEGGTAGNYFLHSTRALAQPNTQYGLTVGIGVRDNPASFGNARLEITSNGAVVASASFSKPTLDALRGSDATATFTDVSISWTTGSNVAANQPLAVRIVKEAGAGTVIDFDNVRFSSVALKNFSSWIADPAFSLDPLNQAFGHDPDNDGLPNGIEAWFGTDPGKFNSGITGLTANGPTASFTHPRNEYTPTDVGGFYQWSINLVDWYEGNGSDGPGSGLTVTILPVPTGPTMLVTATASEPTARLFLRVAAGQE